MKLDTGRIKKDFPLLEQKIDGHPIVYIDSAATSQKPRVVIDAMTTYYETINSNVHRGVYRIAEEATKQMEDARRAVAGFIGGQYEEIVFTKNVTESLNLVAYSWGRANLQAGDVVVLSEMEHHANIVPWPSSPRSGGSSCAGCLYATTELLCSTTRPQLDGAKLVSIPAMSNVLGTLNPVAASPTPPRGRRHGVHRRMPVRSASRNRCSRRAPTSCLQRHRCRPDRVGVLWHAASCSKRCPRSWAWRDDQRVRFDGFTTNDVPWKFEAGHLRLPRSSGSALQSSTCRSRHGSVREHEVTLAAYTMRTLTERFGDDLHIYGPPSPHSAARCSRSPTAIFCARHQPGARPIRRLRPRRTPLRKASHAQAGHHCDGSEHRLRVQRRVRCRCARRRARLRRRILCSLT